MPTPIVYFDLEATGLRKSADIIQIAAVENENKFNTYIRTKKQLTKSASSVTGMKLNDDKELVKNGVILETEDPAVAYTKFYDWLRKIGDKIILVGHGSKDFDVPLLHANISRYADSKTKNQLLTMIVGFADTFLLAKISRWKFGFSSLSLSNVCKTLKIPTDVSLHDALVDACLVRDIIKKMDATSRVRTSLFRWKTDFRYDISD